MSEDYTRITENKFENKVVDYLTKIGGVKQWQYRKEIKSTEQLWENFKTILEQNNRARINGKLSDEEFKQVKRIITNLDTPYKAGQFLYGMNGVCQVDITLDNGKRAFLTVFEQAKTGGGNTVYQVVNQIRRPNKVQGKENRRFDVTLLINGLPIIQIELKNPSHSVNESINQMHQYIIERQYTDIFSTTQILIAMKPHDIKYMANTTEENFNKSFIFNWQDEETSKPIRDWRVFADKFLSIPMAHDMSTNYMILDGTKNQESIKVMRSYQVYATRRVIEAIQKYRFDSDGRLGYIWHTTGSGKTITSFKTAWLASRLPNVTKVIFLVDRIALTKQTADKYKAYDPLEGFEGKSGIIGETARTKDLEKRLTKSSDKNIIVTSIQKMSRYVNGKDFKDVNQNIIFIVDEAHRSTGDGTDKDGMLQDIKKAFPNAGWVGYTGTPRFPETTNIFGDALHVYTITEAISDNNVLGFNVQFKETIKAPENPTEEDLDDNIKVSVYDESNQHVQIVVEDIFKNWKTRSVNGKYNAIFTVHVGGNKSSTGENKNSTSRVMQYYDEFVSYNIKRKPEDRIKVAVSFSKDTSNSDSMINTNKNLHRAIMDYNKIFGTSFDMSTTEAYTDDVARRLNKTADDKKYLDLLIVVNQFLTGFDAPGVNTLYVDRTLKGASLIQAYSRTNRLHDPVLKPWGNVINYRWPKQSEEEMNEAFALYSNKQKANKQMTMEEMKKKNREVGIIAKSFNEVKEEMIQLINKMSDLTEGFDIVPRSENEQDILFDDLKMYSKLMGQLMSYAVDDDDNQIDTYKNKEDFYQKIGITKDEEVRLTTVIAEELKNRKSQRDAVDISQIELELIHVHDVRINYDYLSELIAKLANQVKEKKFEEAQKTRENIEVETAKFENENEKSSYRKMVDALLNGLHEFRKYPVSGDLETINEEISNYNVKSDMKKITEFISEWGLNNAIMPKELKELLEKHKFEEKDLNKRNEIDDILLKARTDYKELASEKIAKLPWIHYRVKLPEAIYELANELVGKYI